MNIQYTLLGLIIPFLLVASSYGASLNENVTNNISQTTLITTSNITITTATSVPITTAQITSNPVSTITTTSQTTLTPLTTSVTTSLPVTSANSTVTTSISTKPISTTVEAFRRKFDGLSFIGGMILAIGLAAIIYLVVGYLRRTDQLPYRNLQ